MSQSKPFNMLKELIQQACVKAINSLLTVSQNGISEPKIYHFDCSALEDFNHIDIRKVEPYQKDFEELSAINGPVLYYFEIASNHTGTEIRDAFEHYKKTMSSKATPAIKRGFDPASNILYVGKVKRSFWGRVIQHLGFYKVDRTQGLQLFYWGKSIGLKVNLFVYPFPEEMVEYMEIIEREVASKLKPILGKH